MLGKMLRCNVLAFDGGFWRLAFFGLKWEEIGT